jgi:hypothetical protein
VRVFVPATSTSLARWVAAGRVDVDAGAHGVTPALRGWFSGADDEELEYLALVEAGEQSLRMIAADPRAVSRRVVVAADVEMAVAPREAVSRSSVRVGGPLPIDSVASVLIDDEPAEAAVAVARTALMAAHGGRGDTDDLEEVLDAVAASELMWFDVTELTEVVETLSGQSQQT